VAKATRYAKNRAKHCGTRTGYEYGCRCGSCVAANSAYHKKRRAEQQPVNPGGACSPEGCGDVFPRCGTSSTFVGKKCRCIACVDANNAYQRDRMAKKKLRNYGPCTPENCGDIQLRCGTVTTYNCQKCRCEACMEASRQWNRDSYAADPTRKKVSRDNARAKRLGVLTISYTSEQLKQKYAYWGNTCHLQGPTCSGTTEDIEHVIPISSDGPNILANIRPSCEPCNSAKWATWPYPIRLIPGGKVKQ
jgi:5-methylcytosine-specific restriction endonuclease McrA